MALTVKMLKGLGLTDEQREAILEEHANTVNEIKAERDRLKADAEKLPETQRQLEELRAAGDGGFQEKYETLKQEFENYKAEIGTKEQKAAKEKAARAYYESKGITGKSLEIAVRGSAQEIEGLELGEDGKIKDTSALDELVNGTFSGLVSTTTKQGAETATPPTNTGGGMTKADIYRKDDKGRYVLSTEERQRAIAENHENFGF